MQNHESVLWSQGVAKLIAFAWAPAFGAQLALELARDVMQIVDCDDECSIAQAVRSALVTRAHVGIVLDERGIVFYAWVARSIYEVRELDRRVECPDCAGCGAVVIDGWQMCICDACLGRGTVTPLPRAQRALARRPALVLVESEGADACPF